MDKAQEGPIIPQQDQESVVVAGEHHERDYASDFETLAATVVSKIEELRFACGITPSDETARMGAFKRIPRGRITIDVRSSHAHQVTVSTQTTKYEIDLSTEEVVMRHTSIVDGQETTVELTDDERGVVGLHFVAITLSRAKIAMMSLEQ